MRPNDFERIWKIARVSLGIQQSLAPEIASGKTGCMADITFRLKAEIAARRADLVALTQDLIRMPTRNPPGANYREICDYLAARLSRRGFSTEMLRAEGAPGDSDQYPRWNVVARIEGPESGACVHFNSHIDVVEAGNGWSVDPFGGEVKDGRVYGRGACDMKGGLAASVIAAEVFVDLVPNFAGAVEISGTADEESGGYGGVAYLAERGFFSPRRVQHVIIPEPLNKDRICLGHRGAWWAEIETRGEIAHGAMPFLGDCAVRHMNAVIDLFEEKLFPAMARRLTEMPVVPEGARQSTMNINSIHGGAPEQPAHYTGLPAYCVPDSCRIVIDRRYLAEESHESVSSEIRALLDELKQTRAKFDYRLDELNHVAPSMTDRDAPVVRTVANAIQRVLGRSPDFVASPGTYDQKHIDRIGRLKNCIAYGPGILELAHKPDEWVGIDDMVEAAQVMALTLAALCSPELGQ